MKNNSVGKGNYLKKSDVSKNNDNDLGSLDNRNYMKLIYESLSYPLNDYVPEMTMGILNEYIKNHMNSMRLMYSELSSYLFSIKEEDEKIEWYMSNLDSLLTHVAKQDINKKCKRIVFKIYDHSILVKHQKEGMKKISKDISEGLNKENKKILMDTVKNSEKQYITILGIFASIVLAFTGGIAFSTSVLSNIDKASIYRLVFVTSLLGFILFNTICVMFEFVREINNKSLNLTFKTIFKKPLWTIPNIVFIAIMIISTLSYYCGSVQKRNINSKVSNGIHMEIRV